MYITRIFWREDNQIISMGFGGHVLEMIKRQQLNRDLQKQNRERFAARKELGQVSGIDKLFNEEKFSRKSLAEEELTRQKVRSTIRREAIRGWTITLILVLIIGLLIYWF